MEFEFAKYSEITTMAKAYDSTYNDFHRLFICPDTHTFWLARVSKGIDEEYDTVEGKWLLERNNIEKEFKGETIGVHLSVEDILERDDLSNWDCKDFDSEEELMEALSDGFGVNEETVGI